jgi:hypothetical protein
VTERQTCEGDFTRCTHQSPEEVLVMILLVHNTKANIKDFIMWADVEFAMQLELLETRKFQSQECTIIDMSELDQLGGIASNEPLYIVCHGGQNDNRTSLDGCRYHWETLGMMVGEKLSVNARKIILFACYAASGSAPNRPIDLFARGLGIRRKGVCITGYQGPTVTNTIGTVTAREQPGGLGHDAFLVVDPNSMSLAGTIDKGLRSNFFPQAQFDSFLKSEPNATARKKAIVAAEKAEKFYAAFSTAFTTYGLYYSVGNDLGLPVPVTS